MCCGCAVVSCSVVSNSLRPHELQPARFLYPWNPPGKNTGVGCHALIQGNLPNPGIEFRSHALQADLYCMSHKGSPLKCYFFFLILKHVWLRSAVQSNMKEWEATLGLVQKGPHAYKVQAWGVRWEAGFRIGNSCTPVADSCQCIAKPIQYCKVK